MALRLQVAGGLAIYNLKHTNFRQILVPKAKTLLLTGDCLSVGQRHENITSEFIRYLELNWKEIVYIPGRSELKAPGAAVSLNTHTNINFTYRTQYPLQSIYTIIGATYLSTGDTTWLTKEEKWVKDILASEPRRVILASYTPLPKNVLSKPVTAIVQGTGKNQFDPKNPIVNMYCDYSGILRSDYNPEFVLEIK